MQKTHEQRKAAFSDAVSFEQLRQNFTTTFCHRGANMTLPEMSAVLVHARDEMDRLRFLAGETPRPGDANAQKLVNAVYRCVTTFDGDTIGEHLHNSSAVDACNADAVKETAIVVGMCRDIVDAVLDVLWTQMHEPDDA